MYVAGGIAGAQRPKTTLIFRMRGAEMFTDYTKILIKSGDGGNGAITFRREKYVAARWP